MRRTPSNSRKSYGRPLTIFPKNQTGKSWPHPLQVIFRFLISPIEDKTAAAVSWGDLTPDMTKQITATKKKVDESYKKREKKKLDFHKKAFKVHTAKLQGV